MRRFSRVVLAVFAGLVLLAVSSWLYLFPLGGIEKIANSQLEALVPSRHNIEITIGNISGNLLSGMVMYLLASGIQILGLKKYLN